MPQTSEDITTRRVETLTEQEVRLWHASLRLWMWKWQTLSPEDRAVFYKQRDLRHRGYDPKESLVKSTFRLIARGQSGVTPWVRYNCGKYLPPISRYFSWEA